MCILCMINNHPTGPFKIARSQSDATDAVYLLGSFPTTMKLERKEFCDETGARVGEPYYNIIDSKGTWLGAARGFEFDVAYALQNNRDPVHV